MQPKGYEHGCETGGDPPTGTTMTDIQVGDRAEAPVIGVGPDVDTCEPQLVHVVIGDDHVNKRPLCGADTLWVYYDGRIDDVTCPACRALAAGEKDQPT